MLTGSAAGTNRVALTTQGKKFYDYSLFDMLCVYYP